MNHGLLHEWWREGNDRGDDLGVAGREEHFIEHYRIYSRTGLGVEGREEHFIEHYRIYPRTGVAGREELFLTTQYTQELV